MSPLAVTRRRTFIEQRLEFSSRCTRRRLATASSNVQDAERWPANCEDFFRNIRERGNANNISKHLECRGNDGRKSENFQMRRFKDLKSPPTFASRMASKMIQVPDLGNSVRFLTSASSEISATKLSKTWTIASRDERANAN